MKFYRNLIFFLFSMLFATLINAAELITITPEQLQTMQKQNALVVDIRTGPEWAATGTIPGSLKLQFYDKNGNYDAKQWLQQLDAHKQSPDQPIILVCRSGNRSAKVGTLLTQKLGMDNIYHLQNGLNAWIKKGNKIARTCTDQTPC